MVAAGGIQSRGLSGTRRRVQWGSQPGAVAGTRIDPRPLAMPVPDRTTNDQSEVFLKPVDRKFRARLRMQEQKAAVEAVAIPMAGLATARSGVAWFAATLVQLGGASAVGTTWFMPG